MKKQLAALALATLITAGCASTDPTHRNIGKLDLKPMQYSNPTKLSELSLAVARPDVIVEMSLSRTLKNALNERLKSDALVLACYLTQELKKSLIAQGFTVTDTFETINNMTFTQKRNTSALFTAYIKIEIAENTFTTIENGVPLSAAGELQAKAKLQIATVEPLSGEMVWIKSVPVSDVSVLLNYPYYTQLQATDVIIPNELVDAATSVDRLFADSGKAIMAAVNKYVSVEEFQFLNTDIDKIKQIKRY